jgi:hypothetical protein
MLTWKIFQSWSSATRSETSITKGGRRVAASHANARHSLLLSVRGGLTAG